MLPWFISCELSAVITRWIIYVTSLFIIFAPFHYYIDLLMQEHTAHLTGKSYAGIGFKRVFLANLVTASADIFTMIMEKAEAESMES